MDAPEQRFIGRFIEMLSAERGAADNTRAAYTRDLDDFVGFLATRRQKALTEAASADISAYLRAAAEAGLAPSSRARRLSAIRQLFKFLAAEGLVADDPARASPARGAPVRCRARCRRPRSTA